MERNTVFEWTRDSSRVVLYFEGIKSQEVKEIIKNLDSILEEALSKKSV